MPKVTLPSYIEGLERAIVERLKNAGIEAEVHTEPVRLTKMHRLYVVSAQFQHVKYTERQRLVWEITDGVLPPDKRFLVNIYTLTPDEAEGKWS
jgi:stress-induced morphogen